MHRLWTFANRLAEQPEWAMVALSALIAIVHIYRGSGDGKVLYWLGSTILLIGVMRMR